MNQSLKNKILIIDLNKLKDGDLAVNEDLWHDVNERWRHTFGCISLRYISSILKHFKISTGRIINDDVSDNKIEVEFSFGGKKDCVNLNRESVLRRTEIYKIKKNYLPNHLFEI